MTWVISDAATPTQSPALAVVDPGDEQMVLRLRHVITGAGLPTAWVSPAEVVRASRVEAIAALVAVARPADWRAVASLTPMLDTIVLAREPTEAHAHDALVMGAVGYLPLPLPDATLRRAIHAILAGEEGFPRSVLGRWLGKASHGKRSIPSLTTRQREILAHIARGNTDKEIAEHIGIATTTVHRHVHNLLGRLGVPNRAAAVSYVCRAVDRNDRYSAMRARSTLAEWWDAREL